MKNFRLYLVLDLDACGSIKRLLEVSRKALSAGIDIMQLRAKSIETREIIEAARLLKSAAERFSVPLIINDRVDIVKIVNAAGLHLGQDDIPLDSARSILGRRKVIGISCHSLKQCLKAQSAGADYISVGPVFRTPTKPLYKPVGLKLIKQASEDIGLTFFAIGGINSDNLNLVMDAGARRIAVVREICKARNIKNKVKALRQGLLQI